MSNLTTAELKAQVDTDLSDNTLGQIIESVERDIEEFVGPLADVITEYDPSRMSLLSLIVRASAIVTVVEFSDLPSDPTKTTLAADDYELSADGWSLRRLSDGTNERETWGWHVVVTFTPESDVARRKQIAVQLSRLEITHTGYSQERVGDWSASTLDLNKERAKILRRLDSVLMA